MAKKRVLKEALTKLKENRETVNLISHQAIKKAVQTMNEVFITLLEDT